jgi:integrase
MRARGPGRWQLRVAAGRDPVTGAYRTASETFYGTKTEATRRLNELAAQHSGGTTATTATLGSLIERWLATARLATGTIRNYRNALRYLPDGMRAMPLHQLGAHDLDSLYAHLERQGVGVPTVRILHAALSSALSQAVKWRWVPANPARNATPPRTLKQEDDYTVTPEILARLMAAAPDPMTRLWLRLAIVTGARRSEVLALRWSDWKDDVLTIAGALELDRTRKTTKTGGARRVTIGTETVRALNEWQRAARERALSVGSQLRKDAYIISDVADSTIPWRPDVATKRFARLCYSAGIERIHLHDLRHAHASQLLAAGVDLATVSRRLGHSRSSTTLDVYAHVVPGSDREAARIAEVGLG